MKKSELSIIIILFVVITITFTYYSTKILTNYEVMNNTSDHEVIEVIDGDTIVMNNGEIIRLLCIDTPEKGVEGFKEAKEFMEETLLRKEVTLKKSNKANETDIYNRKLMYVYLEGRLINEELLKKGLAKYYPYGNDEECMEMIKKGIIIKE